MKKLLWLGVAFTIALSASISWSVFADEAKCIGDNSGLTKCGGEVVQQPATNCIGDASGQTNCLDSSQKGITVDLDKISFGQITETGRSYTKTLVITNNTSEKKTVRVEAVEHNENTDLSMADWVAFVGGKRKFELNAGGNVQVGVRIMVPTDAKAGTHYAKIIISDGAESDDINLDVRADIAGDDYKYGGEITSQSISFFNIGDGVKAGAKVKNSGTAGFESHYLLRYKKAFGLDDWKQVIEETREVIPGVEEIFGDASDEVGTVIGYGIYTVEQRISYVDAEGKQKEAVTSHAVVNLPWWVFAIAGGVIVLIIAIVVIVKKFKKKSKENKETGKTEKGKKEEKAAKLEKKAEKTDKKVADKRPKQKIVVEADSEES